ncbi:phosphatase [Mycobacterium vulneris]|uniref:Phosphatase n=1 Tax=Mycolicibacterium vulneris TaxID=547163 RepID=A0A1X2KH08_9MYCO|nr:HAD-IA family hydrolase [Mycolicibacterium vulneris]OSC19315.1 phosphatase [Mycolicibacterium vulneris]
MDPHVQAILFDIDGTLVDSTKAVERSWRTWAREYHVDAEAVLQVCHGRRTEDVVAQFVSLQQQAAAVARELALEMADLDGVAALPGSRQMLDALPRRRWAAVTSGERLLMTARLEASGLPVPHTLVSAEDVATGKPSPEGYLKAAAALGFEARHCLVVEDSPAGISAGRAAGAQVVAVSTTHNVAELVSAHAVVTDLSCISVEVTDRGVAVLMP